VAVARFFKLREMGALPVLHHFDVADGGYPQAGVIQATDGNFYGTISEGEQIPCCAPVMAVAQSSR